MFKTDIKIISTKKPFRSLLGLTQDPEEEMHLGAILSVIEKLDFRVIEIPLELKIYPKVGFLSPRIMLKSFPNNSLNSLDKDTENDFFELQKRSKMTSPGSNIGKILI